MELLRRLLKVVTALAKLLPVIIEVVGDVFDDGEVNGSNGTRARRGAEATKTAG
jgi:hypothetical protein